MSRKVIVAAVVLVASTWSSSAQACAPGASRTGSEPVHMVVPPSGAIVYANADPGAGTFYAGWHTPNPTYYYEVERDANGNVSVQMHNTEADWYVGTDRQCMQ